MKRVLIEEKDGQRQIALMEDKRLLFFSREKREGIAAEQIYLAKVDRIVKGMEAAFVQLGKDQAGFLPFSECASFPRSGDSLLLQVRRPPTGQKAAYLSADLSLAGRYVILTPSAPRLAVSQKITDEDARAALLSLAARLAPEGMGLVMRTESQEADETAIAREVSSLRESWRALQALAAAAQAPCLILDRDDALTRLLRDEKGGVDEIVTNAPASLPPLPHPVQSCPHPFDLYGVSGKLERSLQRKVWLDCGGFLVMDRTEALTVIDVNSGKYTGEKSGAESTFLRLNLEAAREIARLLRLRAVGGIVLIDFVDMRREDSRAQVQAALEEALLHDPVKTVVHGFTALGLMEMTRKKTEDAPSFPYLTCPRCRGAGIIKE